MLHMVDDGDVLSGASALVPGIGLALAAVAGYSQLFSP